MATNKKRVQGYVSDTAYQYLEDYRVTNELRSQSEALDHLLNSLVGGNPSSNLPSELLSELKGELLSELLSELS
jgi:chitodextrinase